jgi:uncharacterized Zn-finger protein
MEPKQAQFSVVNRRRLRPQNYKCPQCPQAFTSKQHRTVHVRVIHEKRRDYGCGTCGQTFSRKSAQVSHVRYVHEGRRDHECPICKVRFGRKNGLNKHVVAVHWKRRNFKCDCGASFTRKDCLLRHQRGVHEGSNDSRQGDFEERMFGSNSQGDTPSTTHFGLAVTATSGANAIGTSPSARSF